MNFLVKILAQNYWVSYIFAIWINFVNVFLCIHYDSVLMSPGSKRAEPVPDQRESIVLTPKNVQVIFFPNSSCNF